MLDKATEEQLRDAFAKPPFAANKVEIGSLNGDLDTIAASLGLPKRIKAKLKSARRLAEPKDAGETIEWYGVEPDVRNTLAMVPISEAKVLMWVKKERISPEEKQRSYGIDQHWLRVAQLVIDDILRKSYRPVSVVGWIDSVVNGTVKFYYYDEKKNLVQAETERNRFAKVSDLREGARFMIQTWVEGDVPKVDFLPLGVAKKKQLREGARVLRELTKHGIDRTELEKANWPRRPRNWSDESEVDRYLSEWGQKFGGIEFRGREEHDESHGGGV